MPYTVDDVDKYKKGLSDKEKEQWAKIANSVMDKCMEDGGDEGECAAAAIRQASGVLKKQEEAASLAEQWASIEGVLKQVRGAFNRIHSRDESKEISGSYWVRDVLAGHPELGDSVIVDDNGLLFAVAYRMEENQLQFAPRAEWMPVVQTYAKIQSEMEEADLSTFTESASGYAIGLAEAAEDNGNRAPVEFDLKIIAPGAGNKHDMHWYPAEMLKRDAHVFEGVDMFVTDHREDERSERTKVGKIKSIIGFADDGGPIGRAVIYDPELAEKTRNRAHAGELGTLHCSILARGNAKDGKIDGTKYKIVESISHADAVDIVSRAGAGGKALALAESENGGESMADEQTEVIEEQEEPQEEPLEEVTLSEQETPEESTPAPATLAGEKVKEAVQATKLPDAAKARLSEAEYADEDALKAAIQAEIAYIKEVTGSGKPFGQGAADRPPEHKPRTVEEADADFKRILTEVGMPYLAGGK